MPINENMVQDIVQEVLAKMQIQEAPTGKHGVFKDMNEAIEAAKKAQQTVKKMSMDQREKILSIIRKKICENAETMARMGVEETGMGNVGDKILKHRLVAEKLREQKISPQPHGQETEDLRWWRWDLSA